MKGLAYKRWGRNGYTRAAPLFLYPRDADEEQRWIARDIKAGWTVERIL